MAEITWSIHALDELDRHRDGWASLNQAGWNTPVLDPSYVFTLAKDFAGERDVLAVAKNSKGLCAMTILSRGKAGAWHTFEGAGCPFGAWVSRPELTLPDLLPPLFAALPGIATVIALTRQDPEIRPRLPDDRCVRSLDYITTARIRVNGGFADLWKSRSKGFRQNIRTARNRLQRDDKLPTRFEIVTSADEIGAAVDQHGLVESAGWKAPTGNALHPDNPQGKFFRRMMTDLATVGDARVYRFFYRDRLVASALCVHRARRFIVLRTAFDESENFTSPGQLMHYEMFERIFDAHEFDTIDFYGEVLDWERRWTDDVRTMYHVNFYRWPIAAWIYDLKRHDRPPHAPAAVDSAEPVGKKAAS